MTGDYDGAADLLNTSSVDIVSLQHEYGIFGGDAGMNIIELISQLNVPVVTTLHTVLALPTPVQRYALDPVIDASAKIIIMAEKGAEVLRTVYGVSSHKIDVVPHGIPDAPFLDTNRAKVKLGFAGGTVILTFGLLSPSKGIETMLDAMPGIIDPTLPLSTSSWAQPTPISCVITARPIAKASWRACGNSASKITSYSSISSSSKARCSNSSPCVMST